MAEEIPAQTLDTTRFIEAKVKEIRAAVGDAAAINALSGGVDSSTVTMLGHRALGGRLRTVFVMESPVRGGNLMKHPLAAALAAALLAPTLAAAQAITPSREEVVALTSEWGGERFPDGRPKVSDATLQRMKNVNLEEAWAVLRSKGFEWQYEGRWRHVHLDETATMVGRALTATFVPKRPDLDKALTAKGHADGHVGGRNSWPIDMLQKGDVYVANAFGSFEGGPPIGGNLATAVYRNSGNGVVIDGSVRDIAQMETIEGFKAWVRDWHPSYNYDSMLVEINRPVRLGTALCLPGDVVLAKREGVMCIPPQLAELVCKTAELVQLRDLFGFQRIKEGVYTPGQVDQRWSDAMEKDFSKWLDDHIDELPVPRAQIQELLKERTW